MAGDDAPTIVTLSFSKAMAPVVVKALRAGALTANVGDAGWLHHLADDIEDD